MDSNEFANYVLEIFDEALEFPEVGDPNVFLFRDSTKEAFEKTKNELEANGFTLLDLDQYLEIKPEDYSISVKDAGFADDSGEKTINDALVEDDVKRGLITTAKFNKLKNVVDDKTVLIVTYDGSYKKEDRYNKYQTVRSWLKDGYNFHGQVSYVLLNALVYSKTEENLIDFLPYRADAEAFINADVD